MIPTWIRSLFAAGVLSLLLTGCTSGQNNTGQHSVKAPANGNGASQAKSARDNALDTPLKNNGRVTPDYLKSRMKPDMTMEEVAAAFGRNYTPIARREGGMTVWRFDFGDAGYQFQNPTPDAPDVDAIGRGMVHSQLFLTWDPATSRTVKADLYYKAADAHGDHTVNSYSVTQDGQIKEGRV